MTEQILIIDGHPDPAPERFVHALADAYRDGAASGQHEVMMLRLADLEFPLLRTQADYQNGDPSQTIRRCQGLVDWATHVVILYPLWLGSMPAMLKALLEQVLRPGFAFSARKLGRWPVKLQSGKSARIVVTMGMPGWLYRWYFRAHSVRSLQRNILHFIGFRRVRATLIGNVAGLAGEARQGYLKKMRELGKRAR
ncbi:NAD(P)H-dependent oxidoreductase [Peristeroidobacter soli]|jgi:putative NADPH-quinone reductase|uniref:NAD(P)H-dependent oxidoreductase n=1 Tax=Peristeroidobacter soli TaxID=2497877 RepID=UPI00101D4791|nr:NAD(P)H-dependent oxidoreductase [Peristeroidobacter soli]